MQTNPIPVDNHLTHGACPLCRSDEVARRGHLDYTGRVSFSSRAIDLARVPELWRCRQCGSGFVQNVVDAETARRLYSSGEAGDRWATQSFQETKTRLVVQRMGELFRSGGRVIDVGCNTGEMLDFARQLGCSTAGLEYSEQSRAVLREKGHEAYQSFDEVPGQFDIISAFDLIEHLYDVPAFLETCHARLAQGGKLVLLTGDIETASARLAGSHWWYVQYPEHIVFPSGRYLMGSPGFRLLTLDKTYASIGYQRSPLLGAAQYIRKQLQRRHYNGLPSLGPDHMLIVLGRI
jgi:SAM-dependent methyltransferase